MELIERLQAMLVTVFTYLFDHVWIVAIVCGLYCLGFVVASFVRANRKIDEILKEDEDK